MSDGALQYDPQTPLKHTKYRADIDGLRAIAVLSVVIYHAFPALLRGGFVGVDVFFVISGFLISSILIADLRAGHLDALSFYARRVRRIFPSLLTVLVATFAIGWFVLLPDEYRQLGKHIAGSAGFLANFVLWQESGYFDSAGESKPLLHLWSLGIEEQFYLVFPFVLWVAWKLRRNVAMVIAVLLAASFGLNLWTLGNDPVATFYSPLTRFWELLVGAALAWWSLRPGSADIDGARPLRLANLRAAAGMFLLAAGFLLIHNGRAFPGWWAILPTLGAALLISAGPGAWTNRRMLSQRWLVWFGLISFPLYLWHWPLLVMLRLSSADSPGRGARLAVIALAVGLSWLTYRLIERPIRFGRHAAQKIAALLVAMVAVGGIGWHCYVGDGYAFRVSGTVREMSAYSFDYRAAYRDGRCFLRQDQRYEAFGGCEPPGEKASGKPDILLWGDSHAAHLYPGLEQRFGRQFTIVQRTVSSCPPLPGTDISGVPYCREINEKVLAAAALHKPARVILAARWSSHDWQRLEKTIAELRALGVDQIDVVGPVPRWKGDLPKQLVLQLRTGRIAAVPQRMSAGLDPDYRNIEAGLEAFVTKNGARYISPSRIMCDAAGCLVRTAESAQTLTAWDYDHLTSEGSRFLVAAFPEN